MRISDWSSDVCSSDLFLAAQASGQAAIRPERDAKRQDSAAEARVRLLQLRQALGIFEAAERKAMEAAFTGANELPGAPGLPTKLSVKADPAPATDPRSEEHTSELQSLMRRSYAVFRLKKQMIMNKLRSVKLQDT